MEKDKALPFSAAVYSQQRLKGFALGVVLLAGAQLVSLWAKLNPWGVPHWLFESLTAMLMFAGLTWLMACAWGPTPRRIGRSLLYGLLVGAAFSAWSFWFDPFRHQTPYFALLPQERIQRILTWIIGGAGTVILVGAASYITAASKLFSPFRNKLGCALLVNAGALGCVMGERLGYLTPKIMPYLRESWPRGLYYWLIPLLLGLLLLRVPRKLPSQLQEALRTGAGWVWLPIASFFLLQSWQLPSFWLVVPTLVAVELIRSGQVVGTFRKWRLLTGGLLFALGLAITLSGVPVELLPQLGVLLLLAGGTLLLFARSLEDFHARRGLALEALKRDREGLVWAAGREVQVAGASTTFQPGEEVAVAVTPQATLLAVKPGQSSD